MKHDIDAERVNYVSDLTPKQRAKVARLIGNKCLISCILSGKRANALFDTGAQVSVASKPWLEANLPDYMLHDISDLLLDQTLDLKAADGTEIKYIGWTPIEFRLSNSCGENTITVPFLVTETDIDPPIVGFSVIEFLIRGGLNQQSGIETLLNEMIATFTDPSPDNVEAFVDFISVSTPTELCTLKTEKKMVVIPKGAVIEVTCCANTGPLEHKTPILFEPLSEFELPYGLELSETLLCADKSSSSRLNVKVCNTTNHDIHLKGRTVLGHLQLVKSVTPLEVKLKENNSLNDSPSDTENVTGYKVDEVEANVSNSEPECLDGKHTPPDFPPVDLEGLTPRATRNAK